MKCGPTIRPPRKTPIEAEAPTAQHTAASVVFDQVHLVLDLEELATIVLALRAVELHGFADRLDALACQIDQPPEA